MPRPSAVGVSVVRKVEATMNRVKDGLGLPRTISLPGFVKACPILVFLVALGLVAVGVMVFG